MRRHLARIGLMALAALAIGAPSHAAIIKSYTPVLSGGAAADFEGFAEGTIITTQAVAGVTFTQTGGGNPMIDNSPAIFGYGFSSGSGVLTGSQQGTNAFPTVAGIIATFASPTSAVQAFLSDTAPIGNYTITAFDSGGNILESFVVQANEILPPGYVGGNFPAPGTTPLPGIYVGFQRGTADIASVQFGPSSTINDGFAIDDFQFTPSSSSAVPEPSTVASLGLAGLIGLAARFRRRLLMLA